MIHAGARLLLFLLLSLVSGCATSGAASPGAGSVLLEAPDQTCEWLGSMAVRMSSELLMSEDALVATAVNELRERAATRGATHLVVAHPSSPAVIAYGTTAAASGEAYRCPDWH